MKYGIQYGVPEHEYRKLNALNASTLKHFRRSPKHARYQLDHPSAPTARMQLGSALHCRVLEPDRFDQDVAIGPVKDRRTKTWKEWAIDQQAPILITPDDWNAIEEMDYAIMNSSLASDLLTWPGRSEVTAVWVDPFSGLACKARADRLFRHGDHLSILEVKTATDASPTGFRKAVRDYGYDISAAWYLSGFKMLSKEHVEEVIFLVVENEAPWGVAMYTLPTQVIENASALAASYARQYAQCVKSGEWPDYPDEIVELVL